MTWHLTKQPLCSDCWNVDHHDQPSRRPVDERVTERCCMCGKPTRDGIYALYRPAAVDYPKGED